MGKRDTAAGRAGLGREVSRAEGESTAGGSLRVFWLRLLTAAKPATEALTRN